MKKIKFAAVLVLTVVGLAFTGCDILSQLIDKGGIEATQNELLRKKQEIITMGLYPQSEKSSKVNIVSEETTKVNGWDCYEGSDGGKYVKLDVQVEENDEYVTVTKYYKVEPLKWRVLTTDYNGTGKKLLFCEKLVDCCYFMDLDCHSERTFDGKTVYRNNYKYSRVRAFLNGASYEIVEWGKDPETQVFGYQYKTISDFNGKGFLQLAFSEEEQDRIATTLVDNSTGVNSKYKCDDTYDKIFLLSKREIQNTAYGFPSEDDELDYPARSREGTAFAKVRGVHGLQLLRTPYPDTDNQIGVWQVYTVIIEYKDSKNKVQKNDLRGKFDEGTVIRGGGIVPAFCLND